MSNKASYAVVLDTPRVLAIRDLFEPNVPARTLTNDMDRVVAELFELQLMNFGKKLLYRDSEGFWDGVDISKEGAFVSFYPLRRERLDEALEMVFG